MTIQTTAEKKHRITDVGSSMKLFVSNLDRSVTTNDIQIERFLLFYLNLSVHFLFSCYFKDLFEGVGAVRAARVHHDESDRSLSTAEVIFERCVDAIAVQQQYNTLTLDDELSKT